MSGAGSVTQTVEWAYQGTWGVLTKWFKVPRTPPSLPASPGDSPTTLRPADAWLRYLRVGFVIGAGFWSTLFTAGFLAVLIGAPPIGLLISPLWVAAIGFPSALAYLALHLRYDTTWYVLSSRSMRIRRGIWVVSETTITYENIQNVTVTQGPLERYFGIANVVVKTAGGGGHAGPHGADLSTHVGLLEGLTNAQEIREMILRRTRLAGDAGLGDDHPRPEPHAAARHAALSPAHVQALRDIRDALRAATAN